MAKKRMFNKEITESDDFLDLPFSAQAVYFHLCMEADDDGFLNKARGVVRNCGASIDDLNMLVEAGFLIKFKGKSIYVITDWLVNNNKIKADRYSKTMFESEKEQLIIDQGRRYQLKNNSQKELSSNNIGNGSSYVTEVEEKRNQSRYKNGTGLSPKNEKMETSRNQSGDIMETSWRQSGTADKNRIDKIREDKTSTIITNTSVNSNIGADKGVTGENAGKSRLLDPTPCHDDNTDSGKSNTTDTKNIDMTHFSNQAIGDNQLTYPTLTDDKLRQIVRNNDRDLNESYVFLVNQGCDMNDDLKKRLREAVDIEKEIYKKSKSNNAT